MNTDDEDNKTADESGEGTLKSTPEWMLNPIPPTPEARPLRKSGISLVDGNDKEGGIKAPKPKQPVSPSVPAIELPATSPVETSDTSTRFGRLDGTPPVGAYQITKQSSRYKHLKSLWGFMFFCLITLGFVVFYFTQVAQ